MTTNNQKSAVDWLIEQLNGGYNIPTLFSTYQQINISIPKELVEKAKAMEEQQRGYTKEDVLKAGEMGEINHHDTKHIVSYLDEAREINLTQKK